MNNNKKWYGFNMIWLFSMGDRKEVAPSEIVINEKELDFIADMGCNFIRVPTDYRFWTHNFDYENRDEAMLKRLDACIDAVVSRGMHCSLNVHRAPGYCINGAELEKHNLWQDQIAQDAFVSLWKFLAERYSSYGADQLSFDLLNEPPNIGQYGMTRDIHEKLMRRTAAVIRSVTKDRQIILDGLCGGNEAMPELADLGAIHSTRGYQPMSVTHYQADWCPAAQTGKAPVYPGTEWEGKIWNRNTLLEHYAPWKALSDKGVSVHVGEFGCYDKTDHATAMNWFNDLFSVYRELGWGFSLWNFIGEFGIIGHNRPGTIWENIKGFKVDRELYDLIKEYMK
ncbi:MAG: cellulase family glycosylhydrolase [Spirochaetaceae bacterium]|nr:cellulase family glycosylhydrolase [Spirochaetaceae bacterium]